MTEQQAAEIIALLAEIKAMLFWQLAAVCFVAGGIVVLGFFIGKGGGK